MYDTYNLARQSGEWGGNIETVIMGNILKQNHLINIFNQNLLITKILDLNHLFTNILI